MKTDNLINLGVLVILGIMAVLLVFQAIPDPNREPVSTIIGALAGFLARGFMTKGTQDVNVVNPTSDPVPVDPKSE